jgi:hypothetical protein
VAVGLFVFLGVLTWVVTRQTSSVVAAANLRQLNLERSTLEAQKTELLRRIREARSRATLIPRAESLGLRLAADSEIVILQIPSEGNER